MSVLSRALYLPLAAVLVGSAVPDGSAGQASLTLSASSPLGEPIATVTFPRAIAPPCTAIGCRTLLDIGVDHVLLIRRGPLDVPQVHLHRLIKE
jgi:hypothetical protein